VGARAGVMFHNMIKDRPRREKFNRETKAARVIQKFVRPIIWRKRGKKVRRGLRKLKALIMAFRVRCLLRRQNKSAGVIITFSQEVSQQSEMKTAISNFVRHVKRLQRVWRRYLTWKDYVLEVRREQFDAIEVNSEEDWEKQKKRIEKALSTAVNPDPDAIIGDFNMRRAPLRITEAIREQILLESFRRDQSAMRERMIAFGALIEDFRISMTTWKALIEAQQVVGGSNQKSMKQLMKDEPPPPRPDRPIIKPRLSEDEVWVLIKKGHQRMDELEAAGKL